VANDGQYFFPVVGYTGQVQLHHGSEHGATDIMAPRGSTIVAMRGGRVAYTGYDELGGWNVMIQGDDGKQYYYAHMDRQPSVQQGMVVRGGTMLGVVGDTGNAKGTGTHLHIGVGTHIINGAGPRAT
jgi:murein DD-endopeptidase MepM/ murein hydrolase activator NlpD